MKEMRFCPKCDKDTSQYENPFNPDDEEHGYVWICKTCGEAQSLSPRLYATDKDPKDLLNNFWQL